MTTENGAQQGAPHVAPAGEVRRAFLAQVVSTAFSTDSTQALIHFKDQDGASFVLTMTVDKLATIQHLASQMRQRLKRRDMPLDNVVMQFPQTFEVAHSDQTRGVCAVTFDKEMPSEAVYVLTDEAALHLSRALEQNVLSRMSPAERHAHAVKQHPLLLPNVPKIIR
jgi:hypothetical protein